jgi:hypothetical protein
MDCTNQEPTAEDGCVLCGFMKPDFREDEENMERNSGELRGMAGICHSGTYNPTFGQQKQKTSLHRATFSFNVEDLHPVWIKEEIKRLFPATNNPGKFPC